MTGITTATTIDTKALAAFAARMMVRKDLPGLAVAVVTPDTDPALVCHGYADVSRRVMITPDTCFRLGSVSKVVTAMAALQLVESGVMNLDDSVEELTTVPIRRPPNSRVARLNHLLTHLSGLGEIPAWPALRHPLRAVGGVRAGSRVPPLAELLVGGVTFEVPPGTKWAYSNPAFTLVGRLIEEQCGRPFDEHARKEVLRPAGMATADMVRTPELTSSLAEGYRGRRPWRARRAFDIACTPAGGLTASLCDSASFAQALLATALGRTTTLLRAPARSQMFTVQHRIDRHLEAVALPWWVGETAGYTTYSHGGTLPGFSSGLVLCPEAGLAVVALTNRTIGPSADFGGGYIASAVLRWALGAVDPLSDLGEPEALGAATQRSLEGMFAPPAGPLTNLRFWSLFGPLVRVHLEESRLILRSAGARSRRGLPIYPVLGESGDRYAVVIDGVRFPVVFERNADGMATTLHLAGIPAPFSLHRTAV